MEKSSPMMIALIRKARRDKSRNDIEFFASYYLSHILDNKTPPFHIEIRKILTLEKRIGIAAPRGFAKSTNVQVIYAIWCLLFNRNDDILSISQSGEMAEDWIRKVKFELDGNDKIREDFGGILRWGEKDSKRWTNSHIVISEITENKEEKVYSQMRARGRGCQVRGLRPTRVFCDDLEDEELVRSEEQRRFLKEWFLKSLLNVLKFDQQLIVIGTVLHPLALIADIIGKKEEFKGWYTKKYVALENGKSLWQDRFPVKDLERRKAEIGTYAFESEFQNNPISSETCLWRPEWILRYSKPPRIVRKYAALDPAATEKESGDYSAMCCIGEGTDGFFYELETVRGHWGTFELIKQTIDFYLRNKPIRFGIELQAFQGFMKDVLIREAKKRGVVIPLESMQLGNYREGGKGTKQATDKYTRAMSVIHFWEQGQVKLRTQQLVEELSMFPTGSHDDTVDACVYAMKLFMKYTQTTTMISSANSNIPVPRIGVSSFEIKEGQMPNLVAEDMKNGAGLRDWRIGG